MKSHVFIIHAHSDHEVARRLVAGLEAAHERCWIAPRDVSPGADWAAEIIDAIERADVMLLLLSTASNRSLQVRREVERSVDRRKPLLPVQINDVSLARGLEYFLSTRHVFDGRDQPIERHIRALAQAIASLRLMRDSIAPPARSVVPSRTHWPSGLLSQLEALYAEYVGPVASVLVGRASVAAGQRDELITMLAAALDEPRARAEFIASSRRMLGGAPRA